MAAALEQATVDLDTVIRRANREFSREAGELVLSDYQLGELADTIREHIGQPTMHRPSNDEAAVERDQLSTTVEQLRADLERMREERGVQDEVLDARRGDVQRLQEQLTSANAERDEAVQEAARLADELATAQQHRHVHPLDGPDQLPRPCSCGKEFGEPSQPRKPTPEPAKPGKWTALFDQIRGEVEERK